MHFLHFFPSFSTMHMTFAMPAHWSHWGKEEVSIRWLHKVISDAPYALSLAQSSLSTLPQAISYASTPPDNFQVRPLRDRGVRLWSLTPWNRHHSSSSSEPIESIAIALTFVRGLGLAWPFSPSPCDPPTLPDSGPILLLRHHHCIIHPILHHPKSELKFNLP